MHQMKHKLKTKVIGMAIVLALFLSTMAGGICYSVYKAGLDDRMQSNALKLAMTLSDAVNKEQVRTLRNEIRKIYQAFCEEYGGAPPFQDFTEEDWAQYYERFRSVESSTVYKTLLEQLQTYADVNEVLSLYIGFEDTERNCEIHMVDVDQDIPVGYMDICIDENSSESEDEPSVTNDAAVGWISSMGCSISGRDGDVLGNLWVDISMEELVNNANRFLFLLFCILMLSSMVMLVPITMVIDDMLTKPINRMARAAASFVSEQKSEGSAHHLEELNISTGDEIEGLWMSMKKMESDIEEYIDNLTTLTAEKERISTELNVATTIQAQMLPCTFPAFPERHDFEIYASMTPAREVGGDFYDFFLVDENHLALVIADVSGKGVPAALFMVVSRTLIKNSVLTGLSPDQILEQVNNQLSDHNSADMFVTVWLGILTLSTGKMLCANAGHEFPAVCRKGQRYELLKDPHGFVMGGMPDIQYRAYELQLQPEDRLFVYTDGVPEATNGASEMLGTDAMLALLNKDPMRAPENLLKEMKADVDAFVGKADRFDDLTMLSFLYHGSGKAGDTEEKQESKICAACRSFDAEEKNLDQVLSFLQEELEKLCCPEHMIQQLCIAMEELFVNVALYAYPEKTGKAELELNVLPEHTLELVLRDHGIPFNPMAQEDPDVTLPPEERRIGGLGIYMVKQYMDEVQYRCEDQQNILMMRRRIEELKA